MSDSPVAIVTGGARGIGRGIALELAKNGYDLVISDIANLESAEEARGLIQDMGQNCLVVQGDVAKAEDRARLIETVRSELGRLDLLVNNAGVAPKERKDILEASEESYERVLKINLQGPYFLTQLAANWMVEQRKSDADKFLAIVNISSISAYTSSPGRGEYCISKAGVAMMTQLYADRLAEYGINVYEVRPGIIATDMTSGVKAKYDKLIGEGLLPIKRWGKPSDIARAVTALARGDFAYTTGTAIDIDGGFHMHRL
jgi:3-oxoacyl-[acyl-carrier protein] reductase